ncbi:hypothetical protein [Burkholderia cenocepacia]|uniref:hypothetical protein n=1 Tax=Burkholderia cenocepacia TaxID=95486 RepID=UPI00163B5678|nr:hypothetical protein [Burkholderia cenocepacia]
MSAATGMRELGSGTDAEYRRMTTIVAPWRGLRAADMPPDLLAAPRKTAYRE